jgi:hypothetical protein
MAKSLTRRTVLAALGGTSMAGLVAVGVKADQPHMESALEHLRDALKQLEQATPDKGGHRAKAMSLVHQAIQQVERGIAWDRKH